jgi:hypothetical protein
MEPLRHRIRNRSDRRVRISFRHEQGERAPAAAELEDPLAIAQAGTTDRVLKRARFGLGQRFITFRIKAAGVFATWPER